MRRSSSQGYVIGGLIGLWYLLVLLWAFQPLSETMQVGVDYTATPPAQTSVTVECNNLFSSTSRSDDLPVLTPQPEGQPPLAYPREPCEFVRADARRGFIIATVTFVLAIVVVLRYRWRRHHSSDDDDDTPVRSAEDAAVG